MVPQPRTVELPRLLHVGAGALDGVAPLLEANDFALDLVLVGSGPGPSRALAERVVAGLRAHGLRVVQCSHLEGRLDQAAAVAGLVIEEGVTTAVAVGGGRVIDTVKLAAARTGIDFVSVPTAMSNDGISSPVASLVGKDGARASHAARMPCGIVVDPDVIGRAPPRTVRAGAGDLASNLLACLDWRLAADRGHDRYDAFSAMIAESAARPVLDLADLTSAAAQEVLAQGLVLSGLAMAAAGTSRPCSGAEHLISHALDARLGARAALHGEQVALGCLVSAVAHGSPLLGAFHATFARLGLPTRPEHAGLTMDDVADAVAAAPELRPDRWTVLSERATTRDEARALVTEAFAPAPAALRSVAG